MVVQSTGALGIGIALIVVGILEAVFHRQLGEYAHRRWSELGRKKLAKTTGYWIGVAWLVASGWLLIGLIVVASAF